MKTTVKCQYDASCIRTWVESESLASGFTQKLSEHIVFLQEEQIRRALVKLGWIPPGVLSPSSLEADAAALLNVADLIETVHFHSSAGRLRAVAYDLVKTARSIQI